jgi:large subunit ribosomal protein L24
MKIKKGDQVIVSVGLNKAPTPKKVLSVLDEGKFLIVEGVNKVFRHVRKGHPKNPSGGRLELEKPIDSSNVQFYCEKCTKGVKLGYRYLDDGTKERFCRKCQTSAGKISPPRPNYAKK